MSRMDRWLLCWLVLSLMALNTTCSGNNRNSSPDKNKDQYLGPDPAPAHVRNQDSEEDINQDSEEDINQDSEEDINQDSEEEGNKNSGRESHQTLGDDSQAQERGDGHPSPDSGGHINQGLGKNPNRESDPSQEPDSGRDGRDGRDCSDGSCQNNSLGSGSNKRFSPNGTRGSGRNKNSGPVNRQNRCQRTKTAGISEAITCMENVNSILRNGNRQDTIEAMESLEQVLEATEVNETSSMSRDNVVVFLHRPRGSFAGLQISASNSEATSDMAVTNSRVNVRLPSEINVGLNTVVFLMLTLPGTNKTSEVLYENRLVGLSVSGRNISGLQDRVNITMNSAAMNETQRPSCVFLDFSTQNYSTDGCDTLWKPGQSHITCSCNHLTYFGVLLVSADLPPEHQEILSYISLIGCSLSLLVLVLTVLLFMSKRKVRADVSMKIHINLAVALILLNVHFLPSQTVAALSSSGLCLYIALALHYSLLATFSWMALEGFHLYLLLVRVFNIYTRRYLLKLSVVGWGVPAVIVSLVVVIDRDTYGTVPLDYAKPNSSEICYIVSYTVKMVTTVGVFSLVFLYNLIMLGVTIRRVVSLRRRKQSGHIDHETAKSDICTLLGVTALLGIPWGLVFFSFGHLTVPGLYVFCILNSLQGVFVFVWFLMSLRKIGNSAAKTSSIKTQSFNS